MRAEYVLTHDYLLDACCSRWRFRRGRARREGRGGEEEAAEGAQAGEEGARASRPRLMRYLRNTITLDCFEVARCFSRVVVTFSHPLVPSALKTRAASRRARCPPRRTSCDGWRRAPRARTRSASSWLAAVSPGASSDTGAVPRSRHRLPIRSRGGRVSSSPPDSELPALTFVAPPRLFPRPAASARVDARTAPTRSSSR